MMLSKDNTHLRESLDFLTQESRFLVSEEQFLLLRETNGLALEYPTQVCDCTVLVHRASFDPNLPYLVSAPTFLFFPFWPSVLGRRGWKEGG